MGVLKVRDGLGFERRVASMDAERLAAAVREGGLSQVAEKAAMTELAGRVLADEADSGLGRQSGVVRVVDRAAVLAAGIVLAVWLARVLGLLR